MIENRRHVLICFDVLISLHNPKEEAGIGRHFGCLGVMSSFYQLDLRNQQSTANNLRMRWRLKTNITSVNCDVQEHLLLV